MLEALERAASDPAGNTHLRPVHLSIGSLTKKFGSFTALKSVSLDVHAGELICFLGPSGCGKTTLLRAVAGLDLHDEGRIEMGGEDVSQLPPSARDFGIVFQSYALFPNLTVAANVGYGLVNRRLPRAKVAARVKELLDLVGLPDQGSKYPSQLSGGQQQRVALARALATSPSLLLLDEPLSALDARVRVRLRDEIKSLQRRLGVTTVLVTHDQEEALAMADRIVVMNHGVIEQVGTPAEIYRNPATAFVADFIGTMNFLDAEIAGPEHARIGNALLRCESVGGRSSGSRVTLGLRPEEMRVRGIEAATENQLATRVVLLDYLGAFCRATLEIEASPGIQILADFSANAVRDLAIAEGQPLAVALPAESLRVFSREEEIAA
ncbi:MAG: putative 2-aminoethylphosphonate ABC transporter ATP-binding protein [Hyphomicrobiaceae bacterium]|nr:putative 2-aminoethylphosphonate ABC transporter ATP-binding protein [Hyphomicrobiaceae bacterium]